MSQFFYEPPLLLRNGLAMTVYTALNAKNKWQQSLTDPEPSYTSHIFTGAQTIPIHGIAAQPLQAKGTIIGTYGITGDLDNQWFLQILGRKAIARGYAVVFFDWRAHGKTAELSPALTSDGLYEGEDFVRIAAQAKQLGYPAPFWFTGYSLGGQLALWAVKTGQAIASWGDDLDLHESEIGGGAVICPSVDSNRSLRYLTRDRWGRYLEQAIVRQLKKHMAQIQSHHPGALDEAAIARVNSIWSFDHELVIGRLGFSSVEEYYDASSPLPFLPHLTKSTLILYAEDDPMFEPTLIPDLRSACLDNPHIDLVMTRHGGHVGYLSSRNCQRQMGDRDPWWAWNRVLDWIGSMM